MYTKNAHSAIAMTGTLMAMVIGLTLSFVDTVIIPNA